MCPVQRGTPATEGWVPTREQLFPKASRGFQGTWSEGGQQVFLSLVTVPKQTYTYGDGTHEGRNQAGLPQPVNIALTVGEGAGGQVAGQHVMSGQALLALLPGPASECSQGCPEAGLAA